MDRIFLSFIIVSYKDKDYLEKALHSIQNNTTNLNYEILVIDNDNSEELKNFLNASYSNVLYVAMKKNFGFAYALNEGAKLAQGNIFCIMNTDIEFLNNKIQALCTKFEQESIGIIAPKLIYPDGKVQISWAPYPNIPNEFFIKLRNFLYNKNIINFFIARKAQNPFYVKWASAACLFIKKKVWEKLNGFDNNFFLYYEDCDFCLRATKAGFKILYYPELEIIHSLGKSKEKNFGKAHYEAKRSQLYFYKKHNGSFQFYLLKIYKLIKDRMQDGEYRI